MNLKYTLRETTRVSREKWAELALQQFTQLWPGLEKAMLIKAGLGERSMTMELQQQGDTPEIVMRLVAVAVKAKLECEGISAKVLRPAPTQFPWETARTQFGVEVTW